MSTVTPLKKITSANVMGSVLELLRSMDTEENPLPKKKSIELYDVYGQVNGIRTGTSQFGDWTMLAGNFEAVRLDTGEVFAAREAGIPEPILSAVVDALKEHDTVDIAVRVCVHKRADELKAENSYEFTCKMITEVKPNQALTALRDTRAKFLAALPAPKTETPVDTKKKGK